MPPRKREGLPSGPDGRGFRKPGTSPGNLSLPCRVFSTPAHSQFSEGAIKIGGAMTKYVPPPLSQTLSFLRNSQGWTQGDLADASGSPANLISDYERGRHKTLSRERIEELVTVIGLSPQLIDETLELLNKVRASREKPGEPVDPMRARLEAVAADLGRATATFFHDLFLRGFNELQVAEERARAPRLWAQLKPLPARQRRIALEGAMDFRSWALCELVCKESTDAARDSADRAVELAGLALRIAELAPGDEAWRSRLQGYAWAHVGNARRVRSDLPGADEAFRRAKKLWKAGEAGDPGCLLDEARMLGLEASLRRAQRRLPEALKLLDRALETDRGDLKKQLLLNKANTLEDFGDFEGAITALRCAAPLVRAEGEPQLLFALDANLAVNLCFLGQHAKAELLLPELRELATKLNNALDVVRLRWLEGRTAAGLGRRDEALIALSHVRDEFAAREIGYDAALVSLELAVLYLEQRQVAAVRNLARQMLWIFRAQGVHREALAALRLFCKAAEQDTVTLDLARKLVVYFHRAQNDPGLRFEDIA